MAFFTPLLRALPPGFVVTVADVGSLGGLHPRWRPVGACIHALLFDPQDDSGSHPVRSGCTTTWPVALGAASGRALLHVTARPTMTSTLLPAAELYRRFWNKADHTVITRTIEVPVEPLDTLVVRDRLSVDALKIDVQGGEMAVIDGAAATLRDQVLLAEVEVSFLERYIGLVPIDGVIARMRELGFDLIDLQRIKRYRHVNSAGIRDIGLGLGQRAGRLGFADAIFVIREERMLERLAAGNDPAAAALLLRLFVLLLVYGKPDMAARLLDQAGRRLPHPVRTAAAATLRRCHRRRWTTGQFHRVVDWIGRRI